VLPSANQETVNLNLPMPLMTVCDAVASAAARRKRNDGA